MFKKIATISMALMLPIMASAYTPKKEALIVGVSEYKNGGVGINLSGVAYDVKKMENLLKKRGFHVKVLFNSQASLANVRRALNSYRDLNSQDSFFYYESSHGTQIPDDNGDERDGLDEAYVLYDAKFDSKGIADHTGLLIDDELQNMLAHIHAKKVMMVDACYSGTMYKSFKYNAKTKSLKISPNFRGKGVLGSVAKPKNIVVLASSQENEKSIDTETGGLFTEAIYDAWSANPNISFRDIRVQATNHIEDMCDRFKKEDSTIQTFHPVLYTTNTDFLDEPINGFLQVNIRVNQKTNLVEEYLDGMMRQGAVARLGLQSKSNYYRGDNIGFGIDTYGRKGHLYILTIKERENEISVLYPNPYYKNPNEQWRGKFSFPNQHTLFKFKATSSDNRAERTVVYAILSDTKIPDLEVSRGVGYNRFQSIMKDFDGQFSLKNAFKDILVQRKRGSGIAIAKRVFSVQ
jgi:hypothetical protein